MSLSEQIQQDLTAAMKARDTASLATLRMLVAALRTARVAEGRSGELSDEETVAVLAREAKRRNEAAAAYRGASRDELADKELAELDVIRRYLPEPLSEEELAAVVDRAVVDTGASGPADIGRVMGAIMPQVTGRADGGRVQALVRARLG